MEIRPATTADLDHLAEIDGTIESSEYLHLERSAQGLGMSWTLELRRLREKLVASNALGDEKRFMLKQIVSGADDGIALIAEHDQVPVAMALAQPRPEHGTLQLLDVRVDYDYRRQGIATVLVYQIIQAARDQELRAVSAELHTNNIPGNRLMQKLSFEMTGIDTHRHSNHDMVKETATIFWYAAMD